MHNTKSHYDEDDDDENNNKNKKGNLRQNKMN
jgi:hypothetical protein